VRGLRSARHEPAADRDTRTPLRRAQWSTYFLRFFGSVQTGDPLPSALAPDSLEETTDVLNRKYDPGVRDWCGRYLVRRCVSQMLLRGHRPRNPAMLDQLMEKAAQPMANEPSSMAEQVAAATNSRNPVARDFLIGWGEREFNVPGPFRRRAGSIPDAVREIDPGGERIVSLPTRIFHEGGAFTFVKEVGLRQDLEKVKWLVNPLNWVALGEFFARTESVDGKRGSRGDKDAWSGVLAEDFIVSWNGFTTHSFKQKLKVDYTVEPELARTDYSLMYEEDDQIELNQGFFQAERLKGPPGWIHGHMQKTLKFKSSVLNMLAPAIFSMFLDSKAGAFGAFVDDGAPQGRLSPAGSRS
jgi:hypothetical protein